MFMKCIKQRHSLQKVLLSYSNTSNSSIFIYGQPGSGKTFTILHTYFYKDGKIDLFCNKDVFYFNCGMGGLKREVLRFISNNNNRKGTINNRKRGTVRKKGTKYIKDDIIDLINKHIKTLILDEADLLPSKTLYNYLESLKCNLILIGNKMLPEARIESRISKSVGVMSYTAEELMEISKFWKEDDDLKEVVCRRVGAINGDIRRVFKNSSSLNLNGDNLDIGIENNTDNINKKENNINKKNIKNADSLKNILDRADKLLKIPDLPSLFYQQLTENQKLILKNQSTSKNELQNISDKEYLKSVGLMENGECVYLPEELF